MQGISQMQTNLQIVSKSVSVREIDLKEFWSHSRQPQVQVAAVLVKGEGSEAHWAAEGDCDCSQNSDSVVVLEESYRSLFSSQHFFEIHRGHPVWPGARCPYCSKGRTCWMCLD